MQLARSLFRAFDDEEVMILGRTFDQVRCDVPFIAPEAVATAVLAAAEEVELSVDGLRHLAVAALMDNSS